MEDEGRTITIEYCPRRWAEKLHDSLCRWAVLVLHRRAGKTTCILNHHQRAALDDDWERRRLRALLPTSPDTDLTALMRHRIYWHVMPSYKQAKLVAWEMLKHFASVVPGVKFNESELLVKYPNGNRIQLIGADNPDSLRGPGLSGLSTDEYAQHPPNGFAQGLGRRRAAKGGSVACPTIRACLWTPTGISGLMRWPSGLRSRCVQVKCMSLTTTKTSAAGSRRARRC